MLVEQVVALFRGMCDEDDVTFLTDANVATYVGVGHDQFRNLVTTYDPLFYTTRVSLTLSDQNEYNLATGAVIILGSGSLTGARLSRLVKVERLTDTGDWAWDFHPAADLAEMRLFDNSFCLIGTILHLSARVTGTLRLWYVPISAVNWASTGFIDDLSEFHDIIALLAYGHYAVRDGAANPQAKALLDQRISSLASYLNQGRSLGAKDHVAWRA